MIDNQSTTTSSSFAAEPEAGSTTEPAVQISVVVPLYNEAQTLAPLAEEIAAALYGRSYEILFIDDGSQDGSWNTVCRLAQRPSSFVRGFRHRRNFGKAEALATGFEQARGEHIVTIDADLQDDPAEIPRLLAKLDKGYDVVSGWKQRRQDPISKKVPSRLFNFAVRTASGIKIHDFNCGLKAYHREAAECLNLYGELHRFTPVLAHAAGFRVGEIVVAHRPREHVVSKYGWKRLVKGSLDLMTVVLLTRYLKRPGHFFGGIGLACGSVGFTILLYLSVMKLAFGDNIGPRPLFFLGILATLFGAQLITIGFIGEFFLRHRPVPKPDSRRSTRSL